jgi:hypothetical protein
MVLLGDQSIIIQIKARNSGEIFNKMQHGIIDTVQYILGASSDGKNVVLDCKTAKSLCVQLETLRHSLIDGETLEMIMELSKKVIPPPNPENEP